MKFFYCWLDWEMDLGIMDNNNFFLAATFIIKKIKEDVLEK